MTVHPRKILIVLHGSIGDVTRALPLANLIRRGYPKAKLVWAVEPLASPLVEHHPAVDEVILFERNRWWRSLGPFLRRIRSQRFDLVLDLQRHLKSGLISRWSGAPYRLGFHRRDAKELNWLFNNHTIAAAGEGIPKLHHYLKFAEFLGIEPYPVDWGLRLTQEEEASVDNMLRGVGSHFVVFFVGSSWESKQWLPAQTAKSAAAIQERYGMGIVLLGGKEDASFAQEVEDFRPLPVTNLVGQTSLREAVGVLSRARVAVGPDTGIMHLCAAVGTPVVSLWGATDPIRTGPHGYQDLVVQGKAACSPCYLRRCPIGRICMQSIDIEEVASKVGMALSQRGKVHEARI
ncbi:MAG: glycosyltransferase family 9 protein [Candidatus Binatia bacterium]